MIGGLGLSILVKKRIAINTTDLPKVNDKTSMATVGGIKLLSGNIYSYVLKDTQILILQHETVILIYLLLEKCSAYYHSRTGLNKDYDPRESNKAHLEKIDDMQTCCSTKSGGCKAYQGDCDHDMECQEGESVSTYI